MTNKELVLTRINELRFTNKHGDEFEQGYNNALDCIEYFINSCLPTEKQPSRGFEEEFNNFCVHGDIRNPNFEGPFGYDDIRKTAIHFANWKKEQMMRAAIDALVDEDTENVGKKTLLLIGEQRDALNTQLSNYEYGETVKLVVIEEEK